MDYALHRFSEIEIMNSEYLLKQLDPKRFAENLYYGVVTKGHYYDSSSFTGGALKNSQFHDCTLY